VEAELGVDEATDSGDAPVADVLRGVLRVAKTDSDGEIN